MSSKSFELRGVFRNFTGQELSVVILTSVLLTSQAWATEVSVISQEGPSQVQLAAETGSPLLIFNRAGERFKAEVPESAASSAKQGVHQTQQAESLFQEGLKSFQNHDYPAALKRFNDTLALDGKHRGALKYQKIVQKKIRELDGDKAQDSVSGSQEQPRETIQKQEQIDPTRLKAEAAFQEGIQLYKQELYGPSCEKLSEAIGLVSDLPKVEKYLAKARKQLARQEEEKARLAEEQSRLEEKQKALAREKEIEEQFDNFMNTGKAQLNSEEYQEAIETFQEAVQLEPGSWSANSHLRKAKKLAKRRQEQHDEALYQQALEQQRREEEKKQQELLAESKRLEEEIEQLLVEGKQALDAEDYQNAIKTFSAAVEKAPLNSRAEKLLEKAREQQQEQLHAEEKARKLAESRRLEAQQQESAQTVRNIILQGEHHLDAEEFDAAIAKFQEVLDKEPDNRDATRMLSKAEGEKEQFLQKQQEAKQIAERKAREQELAERFDRGMALYRKGDYVGAQVIFVKVLEMAPDYSKAERYLQRARVREENERLEVAKKEKREQERLEALRAEEKQSRIDEAYKKGLKAFKSDSYQESISNFESVLAIKADHAGATRYLAKARAALSEQEKKLEQAPKIEQEPQIEQAQPKVVSLSRQETEKETILVAAAEETDEPTQQAAAQETEKETILVAAAKETDEPTQQAAAQETEKETILVAAAEETDEPKQQAAAQESEAVSEQATEVSQKVETAEPSAEVEESPDTPLAEPDDESIPPATGELTQQAIVSATSEEVLEAGVAKDERFEQHLILGKTYLEAKLYTEAVRELSIASQLVSDNQEVSALLADAKERLSEEQMRKQEKTSAEQTASRAKEKARAANLVEEGKGLYEKGEVIPAVTRFQQALELDPANVEATNFLRLTRDDYSQALQLAKTRDMEQKKEEEYQQRLNQVIPSLQMQNAPIDDVLTLLATLSGMNMVAGEGVEGLVTVNVKNQTVEDTLKLVLRAYGFTYEREGADIIVKPNYKTKIFQMKPDEFNKLEQVVRDPNNLVDPSKSLQEVLYPGTREPTVPGKELVLNRNLFQLIVTDTEENILKVEEFLRSIPELVQTAQPLVTRLFPLNQDVASRLFNIIELMLYEGQKAQARPEGEEGRQLILEKETSVLIVKDNEANIRKVEEVLNDQALIDRLTKEELVARRFKVSQEAAYSDDALIRKRDEVDHMMELFSQMLYAKEGEGEAIAKGRRMFPNHYEGTIDIVDTPENIKKVERFLSSVTGETQDMRVYMIKHADVRELANNLNRFAGRRIQGESQQYDDSYDRQTRIPGQIIPIPETNMILIRSNATALDMFGGIIEMLDYRSEQVEIETRLIEIDLMDLQQLGIDWSLTNIGEEGYHFGRHKSTERDSLDLSMLAAGSGVPEGTQLVFDLLGESELHVVLTLLSQSESTEILSAPKVATISSPPDPATIDITTAVPYITGAELDTHSTDTPADDTLRFDYDTQDVGITLEVDPIVSGDGSIIMTVDPTVSVLVGRVPVVVGAIGSTVAAPDLGEPIIETRTAHTRIRVRDGDTIVIGGMIRDETRSSEDRVPFLSDVPYFGKLFVDRSEEVTKRSLLIFVTARLLKER